MSVKQKEAERMRVATLEGEVLGLRDRVVQLEQTVSMLCGIITKTAETPAVTRRRGQAVEAV